MVQSEIEGTFAAGGAATRFAPEICTLAELLSLDERPNHRGELCRHQDGRQVLPYERCLQPDLHSHLHEAQRRDLALWRAT
jgi:hypothetical protein